MLANVRASCSQWAKVADFTGLWGLTKEMNNLVVSRGLSGVVKASYCLRDSTGQSSELWREGWEKELLKWCTLPEMLCQSCW